MLKANILYVVSEFVKKFVKSIPDYSEKDNDKLPEIARPAVNVEVKIAQTPKAEKIAAPIEVTKPIAKKAEAKPAKAAKATTTPKPAVKKPVAKKAPAKKTVKK